MNAASRCTGATSSSALGGAANPALRASAVTRYCAKCSDENASTAGSAPRSGAADSARHGAALPDRPSSRTGTTPVAAAPVKRSPLGTSASGLEKLSVWASVSVAPPAGMARSGSGSCLTVITCTPVIATPGAGAQLTLRYVPFSAVPASLMRLMSGSGADGSKRSNTLVAAGCHLARSRDWSTITVKSRCSGSAASSTSSAAGSASARVSRISVSTVRPARPAGSVASTITAWPACSTFSVTELWPGLTVRLAVRVAGTV